MGCWPSLRYPKTVFSSKSGPLHAPNFFSDIASGSPVGVKCQYFRVVDLKTSCSLSCTCHCRRRRRRSCLLASQPRAIRWTLTQRLPKKTNLRTISTWGIGAGFRDGPPCLLTLRSTCPHSYGYLSLKFSNHTARSSVKGLAQFAICVRTSAALNSVVALTYLQEPARTGYN